MLTTQNVIHGNLISSPPASIMPKDSKVFDMEQTSYGPEVTLTYQCGVESITILSKQNLCFMEAGNITGAILSPLPQTMNASYTANIGSYFWDKPGSINWEFSKQE